MGLNLGFAPRAMLSLVRLANLSLLLVLHLAPFHSSSLVVILPVGDRLAECFVVCLRRLVASFCARCGAFPLPSFDLPVSGRCQFMLCWNLLALLADELVPTLL